MKGKNKHMTEAVRYYIEKELKKGIPVSVIAQEVGYHRSSVYREIKKGSFEKLESATLKTVVEYGYDVGQRVHREHVQNRRYPRKLQQDDDFIAELKSWILDKKYSPEAALQKIHTKKLCLRSIYNYVHAGYIPGLKVDNLPYAKPKKVSSSDRLSKTMPKGTPIDDRDESVLLRSAPGHWEMDTVYSSKDDLTCLLVLSERMTRQEILLRIPDRSMHSVNHAIDRLERRIGSPAFRQIFKTITCDNGMEFSDWKYIEQSCRTKGKRTKVYFCHPYSSWERGTNENINRMVRRWIPKGDDFGLYTSKEIQQLQDWINSYPRKMFGGRSSTEICLSMFPEAAPLLSLFNNFEKSHILEEIASDFV